MPFVMNFQKFSKIGYAVLLGGIALIGGLLIISTFPISGNFQVKIVLSGSMEPAIKTGSIIVIKPADNYEMGDVITFGKDTRDKVPTTHRIIEMHAIEGEMRFITQGDANEDRDSGEVREDEIIGKVLFSVPYLGFLLDMARKPIGLIVLIGVPAVVIVGDELLKIWREVRKLRNKKNNKEEDISIDTNNESRTKSRTLK